jgi:hypothetical protein
VGGARANGVEGRQWRLREEREGEHTSGGYRRERERGRFWGATGGWVPQGGGGGLTTRARRAQGERGSRSGRRASAPRGGGRGEPAGWLGCARKLAQERGGYFYFLFPIS